MVHQSNAYKDVENYVAASISHFDKGKHAFQDSGCYTIRLATNVCLIDVGGKNQTERKYIAPGFVTFRDCQSICELEVFSSTLTMISVKFEKDWFNGLLERSGLGHNRLNGPTCGFDVIASHFGTRLFRASQDAFEAGDLEEMSNVLINRLLLTDRFHDPVQYVSDKRMAQAIDYIEHHYREKISLSDIACVVGLSEFHFSRLFMQRFGMSSHRFLMRRRLSSAIRFMEETDLSLSDIAGVCGFCDQSHLNRWFARETRTTPRQLRTAVKHSS